jgi:hypothetical protein
MYSILRYSNQLHFDSQKHVPPPLNFIQGKSIFVTEVDDYDRYRSMLYALGAQSVANKMMAHVNVIVHGHSEVPTKVRAKYPQGEYFRPDAVVSLFHAEIHSFGAFIRALERHGFTIRNRSDEGDPRFDHFELPIVNDSLPETLLHYLQTSPFIRKFATKQYFAIDTREAEYEEFKIPDSDLSWYYRWRVDAWGRVSATRGNDDYPLEIKGDQLLRVAPLLWTEVTGMYFHEYPHIDSINGLFIVAGIDARTRIVNGISISRVWT